MGVRVNSVIHEPDMKGIDCDFRQNDIRLAGRTGTGNFPYFPKFRVDATEKCDSNITMVNGHDIFWREDLNFWPNPVIDNVDISLPEASGIFQIIDINGVQFQSEHIQLMSHQTIRRNLSHIPSGTYFMEFLPEPNPDNIIYTGKLVKI